MYMCMKIYMHMTDMYMYMKRHMHEDAHAHVHDDVHVHEPVHIACSRNLRVLYHSSKNHITEGRFTI